MQDIDALLVLAEAMFQREQGVAQSLEAQVQTERARIAEIDRLFGRLFETSLDALQRNQLGLDSMRHAHLSRQRQEANYALATLRAQQEAHRDQMAESFGRLEALRLLQLDQAKLSQKEASRKADDALTDLITLSAYRG